MKTFILPTMSTTETMKAVHYEGPFKVSVKDVALPKIQHPDDVVIKVTTAGRSRAFTNQLCSNDLGAGLTDVH